ncbi:hypothetical protein C2E23DRAFT_420337 [Lenzites betulinus]|nr:hypothetical protein C2E23DRAFT_420337 [Lenzites betulinus]
MLAIPAPQGTAPELELHSDPHLPPRALLPTSEHVLAPPFERSEGATRDKRVVTPAPSCAMQQVPPPAASSSVVMRVLGFAHPWRSPRYCTSSSPTTGLRTLRPSPAHLLPRGTCPSSDSWTCARAGRSPARPPGSGPSSVCVALGLRVHVRHPPAAACGDIVREGLSYWPQASGGWVATRVHGGPSPAQDPLARTPVPPVLASGCDRSSGRAGALSPHSRGGVRLCGDVWGCFALRSASAQHARSVSSPSSRAAVGLGTLRNRVDSSPWGSGSHAPVRLDLRMGSPL